MQYLLFYKVRLTAVTVQAGIIGYHHVLGLATYLIYGQCLERQGKC